MPDGSIVLITGTNSGFGRLTAELLAAEGHRVFATMRDTGTRNSAVASELASRSGVTVLDMEVTSDSSVNRAISAALDEAGRIDCIVNNAGMGNFGVTEGYTADQWRQLFEVNLFGCVRVNRAVLPPMRRQRSGLLIHVSSIAGRLPAAYLGPYSASKWALESYAEILRLELAPLGIDSVIIEPGKYRTEIFGKFLEPADTACVQEYGSANLTGRFLNAFTESMDELAQDPAEIARAVRDLLNTPTAERPFRSLVGRDATGLAHYNEVADHLREHVADAFKIPEMLPYRKEASASF